MVPILENGSVLGVHIKKPTFEDLTSMHLICFYGYISRRKPHCTDLLRLGYRVYMDSSNNHRLLENLSVIVYSNSQTCWPYMWVY